MSTTFARCRLRRSRVVSSVQRIAPWTTRHQSQELHAMGGNWLRAQEVDASLFGGVVWPRLTQSERALSRSQGGPTAGLPFICCPVSPQCQGFPVSSLAAPLVPTSFVRCKLPVWPSTRFAWPSPCSLSLGLGPGSQRVLLGECGRSGVPRGWSSSLPECQSSGFASLGRNDNRRIEIVADGLPLFHGAQVAVDTTMVSALRADGNPRPIATLLMEPL